jgi:hypothetical protein
MAVIGFVDKSIFEEDVLVGKVVTCQKKTIGIIEKVVVINEKRLYKGKTLNGKPFQTSKPVVLANSLEEYKAELKEDNSNAG